MKPFLILQLRPETEAADDEFAAILAKGGLSVQDTHRIRLDGQDLPADLALDEYCGVIVGGGPGCISDPPQKKSLVEANMERAVLGLMPEITARDFPFMGCCYGIGVLAHHLGAEVSKKRWAEAVGTTRCHIEHDGAQDALLVGFPQDFDAFAGHKEAVQSLPKGTAHLLSSPGCRYQLIRFAQNVYATQFHPEADAAGFETRIRIYKDHGYFRPEEADDLIAMCRAADVTVPEKILQNFVARYSA